MNLYINFIDKLSLLSFDINLLKTLKPYEGKLFLQKCSDIVKQYKEPI